MEPAPHPLRRRHGRVRRSHQKVEDIPLEIFKTGSPSFKAKKEFAKNLMVLNSAVNSFREPESYILKVSFEKFLPKSFMFLVFSIFPKITLLLIEKKRNQHNVGKAAPLRSKRNFRLHKGACIRLGLRINPQFRLLSSTKSCGRVIASNLSTSLSIHRAQSRDSMLC